MTVPSKIEPISHQHSTMLIMLKYLICLSCCFPPFVLSRQTPNLLTRHIYFFSIRQKMPMQLIFRNLKKYVSKNKIYFSLENKSNVSLNKKVIFVFHTIFKLDFITQFIFCIIRRCLYSLFILFLFSYISF